MLCLKLKLLNWELPIDWKRLHASYLERTWNIKCIIPGWWVYLIIEKQCWHFSLTNARRSKPYALNIDKHFQTNFIYYCLSAGHAWLATACQGAAPTGSFAQQNRKMNYIYNWGTTHDGNIRTQFHALPVNTYLPSFIRSFFCDIFHHSSCIQLHEQTYNNDISTQIFRFSYDLSLG